MKVKTQEKQTALIIKVTASIWNITFALPVVTSSTLIKPWTSVPFISETPLQIPVHDNDIRCASRHANLPTGILILTSNSVW